MRWLLGASLALATLFLPARAAAAPQQGDAIQTDSLSMLLVNRDYTAERTTSVRDAVNLSGNVGLHYYFVDRVRLGMNLQYTRRLWPDPPPGAGRFQRLALMPQIGWSFYDPFYAALIFSYAPRTLGRYLPDLAVLGAVGAAFPISRRMKVSVAAEVPFAFHYHRTLGLVAVTGVSFRL